MAVFTKKKHLKNCKKMKWFSSIAKFHLVTVNVAVQGILKGVVDLRFDWFGISCMTTDNFCFYLQNRLIQTSQTGGQRYSDTSPFSIPWAVLTLATLVETITICVDVTKGNTGVTIKLYFIWSIPIKILVLKSLTR